MLYIIYGAPCSGKSTYVKNNREWNDVVFDYDEITKALTGRHRPKATELIESVMNLRRRLILDYRAGKYVNNNLWVIATRLTEDLKDDTRGLAVEVIEMPTEIGECLSRLEKDRDGRNKEKTTKIIEDYFKRETDTSDIYNTRKWKDTRESILRRDDFMCQLCKRKGVSEDATQVHHINLLNLRPDLSYDERNLISLCDKCHGGLHDHLRDRLTTEGKQLQRRINKKYRIGSPPGGQ